MHAYTVTAALYAHFPACISLAREKGGSINPPEPPCVRACYIDTQIKVCHD